MGLIFLLPSYNLRTMSTTPKDYGAESVALHKKLHGTLEVTSKVPLQNRDDLSVLYTPGIAAVSQAIAADPAKSFDHTIRGNSVAVISDGSAVLGLGNIGPEAAQPVMAGKTLLFKEFANIDAFPIVLGTQDATEIISTVRNLAPTFGGINLEDISAPRCFEIEAALQDLGIPVMHDDQHGTAVVVLAGLINACSVTGRTLKGSRVVVNGAGAAGVAIATALYQYAKGEITITAVDSKGIISSKRNDLNPEKQRLADLNPTVQPGTLADAIKDADIFIGVSKAGALPVSLARTMAPRSIIFALANPVPEILPDEARAAGAEVIASGRSDYPNQVNNVLAFPGIFRGALDAGATRITDGMLLAAAETLAAHVHTPSVDMVLPNPLDRGVVPAVATAVADAAKADGVIRQYPA